jgi:hypothetical protein
MMPKPIPKKVLKAQQVIMNHLRTVKYDGVYINDWGDAQCERKSPTLKILYLLEEIIELRKEKQQLQAENKQLKGEVL